MSQTNGYLTHAVRRSLGRSAFNKSETLFMSMEQGELTPTFIDEVYPKYTLRDALTQDIELAPQLTPFKGRLHITNSCWFVPYRILWDSWERFINPYHPDEHRLPTVTPNRVLLALSGGLVPTDDYVRSVLGPGSLWDFITKAPVFNASDLDVIGSDGVAAGDVEVSGLIFRAYYKIWFDNYRDNNFIPEYEDPSTHEPGAYIPQTGDYIDDYEIRSWFSGGDTSYTHTVDVGKLRPLKKAWRRDYFTSALPWPQRGTAVPIPGQAAGSSGIVELVTSEGNPDLAANPTRWVQAAGANVGTSYGASHVVSWLDSVSQGQPAGTTVTKGLESSSGNGMAIAYDPQGTLRVATSNEEDPGHVATMRDLTIAERIQRVFERAARSGGRYKEFLMGFFGTTNRDDRLQRPEHLGAHTVDFDGSTVIQVSSDTADSAQGNLAGYARSKGRNLRFKRFFSEHGVVMYLSYAIPQTAYHGGLARQYRKLTRYDFAFPDFEDIGEQAIKQHEIYAPWMPGGLNSNISADQEFGYSPRYADLKCGINRIAGDFATSLSPWHQARMFHDPYPNEAGVYTGSAPLLNRSFIESDPSKRIFPSQVVGDDVIWAGFVLERKIVIPFRRFVLPKLS